MPDANIPSGIRALTIVQMRTGLSRDVVVNSWAFETQDASPADDADRDVVAAALKKFFEEPVTGTRSVSSFFGQAADRGTNHGLTKTYLMGDTVPRTPRLHTWTVTPAGVTLRPIPTECAYCLSFKSTEQKGPRGRGRVFLGPLDQGCVEEETDVSIRPTAQFMQVVRDAAVRMRDELNATGTVRWCVYSTYGPDHLHPVTDVWCDNEFDTVRKRGFRGTARLTG